MKTHDRLAKELLRLFFVDFLWLFFPKMAEALDPNSLAFLDKEIFSDLPENQRNELDLVVRARFKGQDSFCILMTESQAQPQPAFNRRMFRYFAILDNRYDLPVYPIALFSHSSLKPETDSYNVTFVDGDVLRFKFRVIQLSRLNWREFLRHQNPVACALMTKMGMAPEERPHVKLECLRMLARLKLDREKSRFLSGFIDTYLRLNAEEILIFKREADTLLENQEKETIMELTTSWKEEGIVQGRLEGRLEESQNLILRLLRRRLGPLPEGLSSEVMRLPVEKLEELGEALLDFNSLLDLESWLGRP
jgi:hypothetical protein